TFRSRRGPALPARRLSAPSPLARGRAVFAAVAVGAIAVAASGHSLLPGDHTVAMAEPGSSAALGTVVAAGGDDAESLAVPPMDKSPDPSAEAHQLATSQEITGHGVGSQVRPGRTTGATFTSPAAGTVVSTFGG